MLTEICLLSKLTNNITTHQQEHLFVFNGLSANSVHARHGTDIACSIHQKYKIVYYTLCLGFKKLSKSRWNVIISVGRKTDYTERKSVKHTL